MTTPDQPDSPWEDFRRSPAARYALRAARNAATEAGGRNLDGIAEIALTAGLRALYTIGYLLTTNVREAAIAEGRRQAVEGWERQWGFVHGADSHPVACARCEGVFKAGRAAGRKPDPDVFSRLVGPWEPAEQLQDGAR